MKICTITCHDVYNVGASLQAYALQTYLRQLGHDVKIIDYKPEYLSRHFRLDIVGNPKYDKPFLKQAYLLAKLPGRLRERPRKRVFDAFTGKYLDLTGRYASNEELKANPPEADLYIAGSDQIWNPLFPNGKDPAFYLDFVQKGVRAAYAASFAVDAFPQELRDVTGGYLSKFDHIAVRESSGLTILESLGIQNAVAVLDPVFLLGRMHWEAMAEQSTVGEAPYLLIYDFDNNPVIRRQAEKLAAERGWKIYSIFDLPYAHRCFRLCGPETFLGLIRNASFVLSNSFHATAFSVIFQRPFLVFDRVEHINTRMRDLLKTIGVDERTSADETINWRDVTQRITEETKHSKAYLDEVISRVNRK